MQVTTPETLEDVVLGITEHNGSLESLLRQMDNVVKKHEIDSATLELETAIAKCRVDPRVIYCKQTGAPIGTRDTQQIIDALVLHKNFRGIDKVYDLSNSIEAQVLSSK